MSIDIAELRRLAIAAVDGPWSFRPSIPEEGFEGFWIESGVQHITTMDGPQSEERTANAAYIAAANPAALLSLLDELEGLRTENEAVRLANIDGKMWVDSTRDEMEKLRKDAERYRWLRDPDIRIGLVIDKRGNWVPPDDAVAGVGGYYEYEYRAGEELDEAIDAAIRAAEGKGYE